MELLSAVHFEWGERIEEWERDYKKWKRSVLFRFHKFSFFQQRMPQVLSEFGRKATELFKLRYGLGAAALLFVRTTFHLLHISVLFCHESEVGFVLQAEGTDDADGEFAHAEQGRHGAERAVER